jgi:uncharacterized protein
VLYVSRKPFRMSAPNTRRAFIIHGYLGYPDEAWQPWLKRQLESRGYAAQLPAMPHPDRPTIPEWLSIIKALIGEPDAHTLLIAHSLGCQAVIRYLETLGAAGKSVGATILVAGAFPRAMTEAEVLRRTGGDTVLVPWLTTGVDAALVRRAAGRCTAILSDNDPFIPFEAARASYQGNLDAEIVVEHGRGHMNEDDGLTELPSVLRAVAQWESAPP